MATPDTSDRRALLKEALTALDQMQAKLDASERARREPIAVVGMGCRFPGGANDPDAYWQLLREGRDAVREVPADRWDVNEYFDADPKAVGKTTARWGGFLDQVDQFDPRFFNISPREALTLDPQQRLLLEVTWEALENAGYAPDRLSGSATGVFVGITTSEYAQLMRVGSPEFSDVYSATGNALNAAAGRLSFVLGLRGPCMAIDSACSSSLVAVHQACQSLRAGESRVAIAGGVNVLLVPEPFVLFAKWGMMAADGRCKTFDASADGFVRGEGCGVVVLKRLSDAVADGDHIHAVLPGSAVNQDGHSSGLTVPNGPAQEEVLRQALANAGLKPSDIDALEAHGTGTPIGDPIELEALSAVYTRTRTAERPLIVGSVKTNLGHVEAASGLAGLIKVILSLQHSEIPKHLHFHSPNPRVSWEHLRFKVPTESMAWPAGARPRLAGVSSFGFSGTNAHVIVGEPPAPATASTARDRSAHVIPLSARSEAALKALATRYADRLSESPAPAVGDVAFVASVGRAHHAERVAIVARTAGEAATRLRAFTEGRKDAGVIARRASTAPVRLAFLFTGQGSQHAGMGRRLYETEPVFRAALDRCGGILDGRMDRSLLSVIHPDAGGGDGSLDRTEFTQPALFAFEYALSELWRSWGIEPAAVLGHSVGEYVAACVAGVFSLEDGLQLIATRAQLMQALPAGGAMASISAEPDRVAAVVERTGGVSVAALNGPESTVVSGTVEAIDALVAELGKEGVQAKRLTVSHAFHSALLDPMLDAFEATASQVRYAAPRIALISNLTGAVMREAPTAAYWRRHARQPVRFAEGVKALGELGVTACVEIGPTPTLLGLIRRFTAGQELALIPSLSKGRDDNEQLSAALGSVYTLGAPVDWRRVHEPFTRRRLPLPTYPFERQRYWATTASAPSATGDGAPRPRRANGHPLLGEHLEVSTEGVLHVWDGDISTKTSGYLADHTVQGVAVVPATAYAEMAAAAAAEALGEGSAALTDVTYHKPLFLPDDKPVRVQVVLRGPSPVELSFRISSTGRNGARVLHVTGRMRRSADIQAGPAPDLAAIRARCTEEVAGPDFYRLLAERGNDWGPMFQGLQRVWRGDGEALALVEVHEALRGDLARYVFHPAVSDASGHVLTATIPLEKGGGTRSGAFVGGSIDEARLYHRPQGTRLWAYARRRPDAPGRDNVLVGDVQVIDETGAVASETIGARLFYLDRDETSQTGDVDQWISTLAWESKARDENAPGARRPAGYGAWLIFADQSGVADALVAKLLASGARVVRAIHGPEYVRLGDDQVQIRPDAREDVARLAAETLDGVPPRAIVHLWSLDAAPAATMTPAGLDEALVLGCGSGLHLAQQFGGVSHAPRIWFVTRHAQQVGSDTRCEVGQAPLWGFGRTLAVEHAELWGGLIDVGSGDPDATSALVYDEVTEGDADDQVAFRDGGRFVARLQKLPALPPRAPIGWRVDATYAITGAFGGLGLEVARWMVGQGARRLLLIGRSPLPPRDEWNDPLPKETARRIARIRELESLGAAVHVAAVDVGNEADVRAFLAQFRAEGWPSIRGVVHAAGLMQYEPMAQHSLESMRTIAAAKARGAWILHTQLNEPLDFFVNFSSASALLSSPLLGSYAAANACLDALAHHRRAHGLTGLSINWGLWSEVGMMARFAERAEGADRGPSAIGRSLTPAQGLEALERLMRSGVAHAAVIPVEWNEWARLYGGFMNAPFLSQVIRSARTARVTPVRSVRLRDTIRTAGAERPALVRGGLVERIGGVLAIEPTTIEGDQPITSMGLDSLMAVELKNQIEEEFGVSVPIVQLLQGPTVDALVTHLLDRIDAGDGASGAAPAAASVALEEGEI